MSIFHLCVGCMTVNCDSLEEASREFQRVQQNLIDRGLRLDQIPRATVHKVFTRKFWDIEPTGQIYDRDGQLVEPAAILASR